MSDEKERSEGAPSIWAAMSKQLEDKGSVELADLLIAELAKKTGG